MIIVLEGIDGCGKTTLAHCLIKHLKGLDIRTTYRHYPYSLNQKLAEKNLQYAMARDLLLHPPMPKHLTDVWVLDRYTQSSYVYGMPNSLYGFVCSQVPTPDVSILLDITPEESLARCCNRAVVDPLGYDNIDVAAKAQLIEYYHDLDWDLIIDATLPTSDQLNIILQWLKSRQQ